MEPKYLKKLPLLLIKQNTIPCTAHTAVYQNFYRGQFQLKTLDLK